MTGEDAEVMADAADPVAAVRGEDAPGVPADSVDRA